MRYSYREALKRHDDTWFVATGIEVAALPGEIRAWRYPETPLGAGLFRVSAREALKPRTPPTEPLRSLRTQKLLSSAMPTSSAANVREAQPGDLLFYRQFGQSSPWHSMIVTRIGGQAAVVYDTGADHGRTGELRRVALAEVLDHPQPQWRPVTANPNFLGVYRWNILRGTL